MGVHVPLWTSKKPFPPAQRLSEKGVLPRGPARKTQNLRCYSGNQKAETKYSRIYVFLSTYGFVVLTSVFLDRKHNYFI